MVFDELLVFLPLVQETNPFGEGANISAASSLMPGDDPSAPSSSLILQPYTQRINVQASTVSFIMGRPILHYTCLPSPHHLTGLFFHPG